MVGFWIKNYELEFIHFTCQHVEISKAKVNALSIIVYSVNYYASNSLCVSLEYQEEI